MKHDWKYQKLKEVCQKGSSNLQQNKLANIIGPFPVYGASGYVQDINIFHQAKPYIGIVKDGSGVGRVNTYPAQSSLLGTMQYIIPNEIVLLGYLAYCLKSMNLAKYASGAAIPHIYFRDYGEEWLPVPPLPVQQQIVDELDKLSEIIEKKKQQVKELDTLAQAIFYDMFGDPVENEKGWEVKGLNEVCDVRDGTHDSPKYIDGGDYILITSKNIVDGRIDYSNVSHITKEDYDAINKRSKVDDGDIIMAMIGTIGKPIIVKMEDYKFCIKNVALIKFPKDSLVSNIYVRALLGSTSFAQHIMTKNQGGTQKFIALGTIRKLGIPLPPLPHQQSFAQKIEAIEKQKELINQSIKETQTLFDSRMDYYFGE